MRISERECERMWVCIWVSVRVMAFSSLSLSIVRRCCVRMNVCVWVLCTSEMKRNLAVIKKNSPNRASNNRNVYTMLWCANTDSFAGACADLTGAWPVFPVFHKISSGSLRNIYMCVCVFWPSISFRVNFSWLCFNWIISRTENDVQIVFNFNL